MNVRRHRFLHEDVFAGVDCIFEVFGPKARGFGEDDDVDSAVNRLLISVESDETPLGRNIEAISNALAGVAIITCRKASLYIVEANVESVLKGVRHGPEFDRPSRRESLHRGSCAAGAAAYEGDFDFIGSSRVNESRL
jgi:hypothetical protein